MQAGAGVMPKSPETCLRMNPSTTVESVSSQSFDALTTSAGRVVIDFGATWCAPCRALAPSFEAVSRSFSGQLRFGAVDIDDEPALAQALHIHSIPTLVAFENGREVGRVAGALPSATLTRVVERFVAGAGFSHG